MTAPATDLPDRCPRCRCDDCGGTLAQHGQPDCTCEDCAVDPELTCTQFLLPGWITLLAEQLGPLLSSHLNERARRRCLTVAHTAYHTLIDYNHPEETR